jgi:hypothetical protein
MIVHQKLHALSLDTDENISLQFTDIFQKELSVLFSDKPPIKDRSGILRDLEELWKLYSNMRYKSYTKDFQRDLGKHDDYSPEKLQKVMWNIRK